MFLTDQESYIYIPLSSFIILLVLLLACASRKRKVDAFGTVEQSLENDIKGDYVIMCFPCLKRKPELNEFEHTVDLSDQFEYIVEKYTIRKVPLLLANTTEDIIEKQEELNCLESEQNQQSELSNDFLKFQLPQEAYGIPQMPPVITVAANTTCPVRKGTKERPKPTDILESMSPIARPSPRNPNYVVIPTKGSLKHRDIMMTKREITNQYLNNFSSVFVDNLKDQVPKDPERFPNLSRPYTSALRNLPLAENIFKIPTKKKTGRRSKSQKVAYTFSSDDSNFKQEESYKEFFDNSPSDSESKEETAEALVNECPEDNETCVIDTPVRSKSLILLHNPENTENDLDGMLSPFETTVKSSDSETDRNPNDFSVESGSPNNPENESIISQKDDWTASKNITYEDIQSLDVGYEFTSSEKLGVKPKMTRIHYPLETEKLKESLMQSALGDCKISKKSFSSQDQALGNMSPKSTKNIWKPKQHENVDRSWRSKSPLERSSSKNVITETSFLSKNDFSNYMPEEHTEKGQTSTTTFTSKSVESKARLFRDMVLTDFESPTVEDTVAEISKLYELTAPIHQSATECSNYEPDDIKEIEAHSSRYPIVSKSRSFHETGRAEARKDNSPESKGKDYLPYQVQNLKKNPNSSLEEQETETTCSLYSRNSKTSSMATSPRSSDPDEGKRATLRWKIVIKHHRDDDPKKKNVNLNIKH